MLRHALASLLALAASLLPQGPTPAGGIQSGPRVVLEGLSGEVSVRALEGFTTEDPRALGAHVVRFEGLPARTSAPSEGQAIVVLSSGERLLGTLQRTADEALAVTLDPEVRLPVSLESLRSITFPDRVPAGWNAPLERPKEGDRVYRRKNDTVERIDGGVESFGEASFRFHDERIGSLDVAWSDLVALFVDSGVSERVPASEGSLPVVVDLSGASRVFGTLARIDATGVSLIRPQGERVRFPVSLVLQVLVDDGRVVFLSDLAPQSAPPSRPFGDDLGMEWRHLTDRSVVQTPLSASGRTFSRGLGVHAPSRLVWALDGGYAGLTGLVAVDDSVMKLAEHGSVRFRVLVDGQKRFESRILHGGDAPQPIVLAPAELTGAKELVLEVDTGNDDFTADRADWLQVRLVRNLAPK